MSNGTRIMIAYNQQTSILGFSARCCERVRSSLAFDWIARLAMCLAAVPLAIIIVPGEFVYPWPESSAESNTWQARSNDLRAAANADHLKQFGHRATTLIVYEHGWPKPFLARAVVFNCNDAGHMRVRMPPWLKAKSWFLHWGGSRYIPVSWSSLDNWPFSANAWIVDRYGVLVDLFVAMTMLIAVGSCTQWWFQSRGRRLWTFRLSDMFCLVTVLAIALGVYVHQTRIRTQEGLEPRALAPGFALVNGNMTAGQDYCGPVWLRKLAGNKYFPQLFHHVTDARIRSNQAWQDCYDQLLNFPYLHTLSCPNEIPVPALSVMAKCRQLKHLKLEFKGKPKPPAIPSTPTLGVDKLHLLEQLPLETIELSGIQVEARHIEQLAAHPTLKRISVLGTSASAEAIESIQRKYPQVIIDVLYDWGAIFN